MTSMSLKKGCGTAKHTMSQCISHFMKASPTRENFALLRSISMKAALRLHCPGPYQLPYTPHSGCYATWSLKAVALTAGDYLTFSTSAAKVVNIITSKFNQHLQKVSEVRYSISHWSIQYVNHRHAFERTLSSLSSRCQAWGLKFSDESF